jgi:2-methylisocitrate lyase-like PEP mutase family enzyme
MLERIAGIAGAVAVPVTADVEAGYADDPDGVGETIRRVIAAGAVGANLEDADPAQPGRLFAVEDATARLAAARAAADAEGVAFTLNARTDAFLRPGADPFAEAAERAAAYAAAGADCLFVPGLDREDDIARMVALTELPLNVVAGLTGVPLSLADHARLGVRRVTLGGSLYRAAMGFVRAAARDLLDGRFDHAAAAIPHAELDDLMAGR